MLYGDLPRLRRLRGIGRPDERDIGNRAQGRKLLDGLMRRPVLAEPDGVVRVDEDHALLHDGRETHRRTHVVREDQERPTERNEPAVQRHAVHDRAHAVLANAEVHVALVVIAGREILPRLHGRAIGRREVRGAANELRHHTDERIEHGIGRRSARNGPVLRGEIRDDLLPSGGQRSTHPTIELLRVVGIRSAVLRAPLVPFRVCLRPAIQGAAPVLQRLLGDVERLVGLRPSEILLGRHDFVGTEGLAMRGGGVLLLRAAVADVRPGDDQRWTRRIGLRFGDGFVDRVEIVDVRNVQHLPAIRLEPFARVIGVREVGATVDRDAIVIVEADELSELEVSREGRSLVGDALHEVAVATDEPCIVVDDRVSLAIECCREMCLRHGHADRVPDALSERARCRLHTGCEVQLRMSRRPAAPLAELLQVVEREAVAAEVETTVQQHGRVAARQHEAIAVGPMRVGGIMLQVLREEQITERRESHRRAGMTRVGLLHGVHGQRADGVDGELVECGHWHARNIIVG